MLLLYVGSSAGAADEFQVARLSNRTGAAPTGGHDDAMQRITPCLWFDTRKIEIDVLEQAAAAA
jgi:hypothetical protein